MTFNEHFNKHLDEARISGSEYHKSRKDAFEGTGEAIGKGRIKLQLTQDESFTCVKNMEEQDVRFVKGTIFNCNSWEGDFYTCQSKEYGGIVVFPNNVKILSAPPEEATHLNDENAEETAEQRIAAAKQAVAQAKGQIAQAKIQGQMKHYGDGLAKALGKSENAEGQSMGSNTLNQSGKKFLMINWDEQTLKVVPEASLEKWLNIQKKEAMKSFTTETEEERKRDLDQIGFELNSIQGNIKEYFVGEGGPSFVNLN